MSAGGLEYGVCAGLGFMGAFGCMDYLMFKQFNFKCKNLKGTEFYNSVPFLCKNGKAFLHSASVKNENVN